MTRHTYHHGDLPDAVMGAALEEMERGDRFAVNFNRIARELGVSHSAIYRHFPNKQALIDALARRGFEQLGSDLGAALAELEGSGAGARIRALARTFVAYAISEPMVLRIMFSGAATDRDRDPDLRQAALATIGMLHREVKQAAAEGWVPPHEVGDVTRFFWASMYGIATLKIEGQFEGMLPDEAAFDRFVERSADWLALGVGHPPDDELPEEWPPLPVSGQQSGAPTTPSVQGPA